MFDPIQFTICHLFLTFCSFPFPLHLDELIFLNKQPAHWLFICAFNHSLSYRDWGSQLVFGTCPCLSCSCSLVQAWFLISEWISLSTLRFLAITLSKFGCHGITLGRNIKTPSSSLISPSSEFMSSHQDITPHVCTNSTQVVTAGAIGTRTVHSPTWSVRFWQTQIPDFVSVTWAKFTCPVRRESAGIRRNLQNLTRQSPVDLSSRVQWILVDSSRFQQIPADSSGFQQSPWQAYLIIN